MATPPRNLSSAALEFMSVRHLATLTTLRPDGSPHVVPVGFTWDPETSIARVITSRGSRKARNALAGCPAVLCQVDGRHWLSLQGTARVLDDPASVADAEQRYAARYREPRPNPERVVIAVDVRSVLGNL
ncbi:PPOX class F420-dependent oxidoreductase [Terrabacter sp. Root181]|uniref:PPOX class F420-dependent oxidoreductase n=1 Tax=Terrabacter sp. Root181 TaxID=1736484 RepID=UPI0026F44467|nr:PPOX class F420-dependent oxidoreductase [Terrabacter sp. Root181]